MTNPDQEYVLKLTLINQAFILNILALIVEIQLKDRELAAILTRQSDQTQELLERITRQDDGSRVK